MHISLDSALGQQRRLNQVGETISSIAAPTAAYSLRSITGGDPKAVRVRRSSDDSEQDFTVSGVFSGALVNFVNAEVLVNQTDASWTGWNNVGNASSSTSGGAITVTGATAANNDGIRYNAFLPLTSNKYRFVFNVSALNLDGATSFQLKGNGSNIVTSITSTGSYSVEHTVDSGGWGSFINFTLIGNASSGASITIDSLQIYSIAGDGFVETWYDQLGSSNVTQSTSTKQPKIVNAGALLQDANGNPYLEFDGTDDFYNINKTTFRNVSYGYASAVAQFNDTTAVNEPVYYASVGTSGTKSRALLGKINSAGAKLVAGARRLDTDGFRSSQETANTNKNLLTGLYQWGDDELQLFVNGAAKTAASFTSGSGNTSDTDSNSAFIGRLGSSYYDGKIYELILYNTDQSGNRQALETNIANEYNITLS